jgi:hypothetical protein
MTRIHEILGKTTTSAEGAEVLAPYPNLRVDVEDLGPGAEPVRYLTSEADGLLIKLSHDGIIRTIFLMGEGKDGFAQFRGELPGGVTFAATRPDVLRRFGPPAYFRNGGKVGPFEVGDLLRFDLPTYSVHFQFRRDGTGTELVTIMTAEAVPGRSRAGP